MSGSYLLDTNIAIAVLNRKIDLEARQSSGFSAFLSLTVVGELLFGAAKSAHPAANRAKVERLIEVCALTPHDLTTAWQYGQLKAQMRMKGRPIPENDLWIAASALQHGLVLVTRDRHFDDVEELEKDAW